jgi:hypothetical protein
MPVNINYVKGSVILECPCGKKTGKMKENTEEYKTFIRNHGHHGKRKLNV